MMINIQWVEAPLAVLGIILGCLAIAALVNAVVEG
jgi:hypothetical protein